MGVGIVDYCVGNPGPAPHPLFMMTSYLRLASAVVCEITPALEMKLMSFVFLTCCCLVPGIQSGESLSMVYQAQIIERIYLWIKRDPGRGYNLIAKVIMFA